jgi:hypothetical protein
MPDEPWAADIERLYGIFVGGKESPRDIDDDDRHYLREAGFSEARLREAYEDGYLPDRDVTPDERHDARISFIEWMHYLGYDEHDSEFWEEWRVWYEEQ